ncbi:30S ribosomal protein S6 [Candidatus Endowatersipora endosymbiont of Watersipora subatra]|uniref:30S ribosomal protein S6 n=1 Tax=Candidatus Endowatersipora endosymbiont of Watersipora subatra TaxID=3077946 RepID=UPI003C7C404A
MPFYEHIFMTRQDVSSQQVDALVDNFKTVLEKNGGSVLKIENWGLKTLPYRVKKNRKAYYALMNIESDFPAIFEMERQMRLHEDVLRYMTIRVDQHETGPSVMLRKREREDRRSSGGRMSRSEDQPAPLVS